MRPIIVKFLAYFDKKELYEARRKLRTLKDTEDKFNGATRIYINAENLTTSRKILYTEVRKRVKQNNWFASWTYDGNIFVKKEHRVTQNY